MRPFRNGNNNSRSRNYPATTNNAPLLHNELQNLDMELQILKRQREIIFKQRQVENELFSQRLNTFNQPSSSSSSSFDCPEPTQNWNASYSTSYGDHANSKGYKRSAEWGYDHPAPKQARSNDYGEKYENIQSSRPKPLMNIPTQQYKKATKPFPNNKPKPFEPRSNNPSRKPQKDFRTSPPKSNFKKNSNKFVAPAVKSTPTSDVKKKNYTSEDVLRPGVAPTPSVNGRLELALGELLKHVKSSQSISDDLKKKMTLVGLRSVKRILRQRISTAMMNRQVRSMAEIVAQYRKKYPKDVDDELIEAIEKANVEASARKEKVLLKNISGNESERIDTFFKSKINMLLKNKIQRMIDDLFKIYGSNEEEIIKCIDDLPELNVQEESEKENKDEATDVEIIDSSSNDGNNENKTQEKVVEPAEVPADNNTADVEILENKANKANNADAQKNVAESTENVVVNKPADSAIDLTSDDIEEKSAVQNDKKAKSLSKVKQYYKLMDMLIENRLPKLLLKFKDEFAKMLYCEKDFIIGKEMIMRELKETLRKSLYAANNNVDRDVITTVGASEASNQEPDSVTTVIVNNGDAPKTMDVENQNKSEQQVNKQNVVKPQTVQKGSQLYVMLLGRPSLPTKSVIYDFLNKFNPKSIKKHKTVNNLLVIGFENKQDYDKILEANETKVGEATFIIKANEVIASDKQKEKAVENVSPKTEEINKATEEQVEVTKETIQTDIKDTSDEKTETKGNDGGQVKKNQEENTQNTRENSVQEDIKIDDNSTEINDVNKASGEVAAVNNEVKEIAEQNDAENAVTEEEKDSPNTNEKVDDITEGNVKTDNVKDTNENVTENTNNTDEVSKLETIEESDEMDKELKAKTRAAAVATPTRSSSRLANITPSTIKTRRASRLAQ